MVKEVNSKMIRVSNEVHKGLIRLSSNKLETFSDVILKLIDYYDKGHSQK
jgi:predicted CopG family antitoxin